MLFFLSEAFVPLSLSGLLFLPERLKGHKGFTKNLAPNATWTKK